MTPFPSHLNHGSNCPCGIGTVTGVMDGRVTARAEARVWGMFVSYVEHSHTFASVATLMRKAKWGEVDRARWPHQCVRCGAPGYVGLNQVECSDGCGT